MAKRNFSRESRLLTPESFNSVFKDPIKAGSPSITVLAKANGLGFPRLGLIVPKKALKKAVWRNRIKRVVRENFRNAQEKLCPLDFVVIAKSPAQNLSNRDLDEILTKLWNVIYRRYKKLQARLSDPTK